MSRNSRRKSRSKNRSDGYSQSDKESMYTLMTIMLFALMIMFFLTLFTLEQQYKALAGIIDNEMHSTIVRIPAETETYELKGTMFFDQEQEERSR